MKQDTIIETADNEIEANDNEFGVDINETEADDVEFEKETVYIHTRNFKIFLLENTLPVRVFFIH